MDTGAMDTGAMDTGAMDTGGFCSQTNRKIFSNQGMRNGKSSKLRQLHNGEAVIYAEDTKCLPDEADLESVCRDRSGVSVQRQIWSQFAETDLESVCRDRSGVSLQRQIWSQFVETVLESVCRQTVEDGR